MTCESFPVDMMLALEAFSSEHPGMQISRWRDSTSHRLDMFADRLFDLGAHGVVALSLDRENSQIEEATQSPGSWQKRASLMFQSIQSYTDHVRTQLLRCSKSCAYSRVTVIGTPRQATGQRQNNTTSAMAALHQRRICWPWLLPLDRFRDAR